MPEVRQTATFARWFAGLRDGRARARIQARIDRLAIGNAGDVKPIGGGVSEMRIDYGPGYRVYFVERGTTLVVLLAGGDKGTQQRDIKLARDLARNRRRQVMAKAKTKSRTKAKTIPWDSAAHLKTDEDIGNYLEAVFENGDPALITHALGVVARAKGMSQIAQAAGLGRESLYKALSPEGNPEFATVLKVMRALGLKLRVAA
jgi:putative addiction module killer protein/probable addiction module antidote protein